MKLSKDEQTAFNRMTSEQKSKHLLSIYIGQKMVAIFDRLNKEWHEKNPDAHWLTPLSVKGDNYTKAKQDAPNLPEVEEIKKKLEDEKWKEVLDEIN